MTDILVEAIKWAGSLSGIAGALIIALNLPWSRAAFIVWIASNSLWIAAAIATSDQPLFWMQAVYLAINGLALYRWYRPAARSPDAKFRN